METKVILQALAHIVAKADSIEEIYYALSRMANTEGIRLEPLEVVKKEISELNLKKDK